MVNPLTRNDVTSAITGLGAASFGTHLWLFLAYVSSHPRQPDAELGFIHALTYHGSNIYVTDAEATGLALLWIAFFVSIILAGILTRRGERDFAGATSTEREKIIFAGSLLIYTAAIYLAGQSMANFAVSHGIILHL
jgi:hypothetical protein